MGNISSINFKAVKEDSEAHNFRKKSYDYIRKDLSDQNEYWSEESIASRLQKVEEYCKETSGRKLQKNAMPIREAVVVINETTTMFHLQNLSDKLQSELGIKVFQIVIHKDEGHYDSETKKWKPNLHAHLVADWQDIKTGKTLKHKPLDYVKMQDITAEILGMERGERGSAKVRLEAMEFKLKKKEEEYNLLTSKINSMINSIQENNLNDLVSESRNLFGSTKIDMDKTIDNFNRLIQAKNAKSEKTDQLIKIKEKEIADLKVIVNQLKNKIDLLTTQKSIILTNSEAYNEVKAEYYEDVSKLLRKEILNYRNKNRFKVYKENKNIFIVLNQLCQEISQKNNIPFSIFKELTSTKEYMYSCYDLITKGKIRQEFLNKLGKKNGLQP